MYNEIIKDGFMKEVGLPSEYNLSDIIRYNGKIKIRQENVAEHSFYTALNVMKICDFFNIPAVTMEKAVVMAIVHDIPEWLVGDIPFEFKRDNPEIIEEFDRAERETMKDVYRNSFETIFWRYLDYAAEEFDKKISDIVDFADNLCAWQYANREYELGNRTADMVRVRKEAKERVDQHYDNILSRVERGDYECQNS